MHVIHKFAFVNTIEDVCEKQKQRQLCSVNVIIALGKNVNTISLFML